MKLPGIQKGPVQSLGRESNARAQAELAKGQAFEAMTDMAAGVLEDTAGVLEKYEISKADRNLWQTMSALSEEFKDVDEVDALDPRLDNVEFNRTDENGDQRLTVPTWEVYGQLYQNTALDALEKGSKMLTRPGAQSAWLDEYEPKLQANIARTNDAMIKLRDEQLLADQNNGLAEMAMEGRWVAMKGLLTSYLGNEDDRRDWEHKIEVGQINDVYFSGDVQSMESAIEILSDENYTGTLEGNERRAMIRTLEDGIEFVTAEETAKAEHRRQRTASNLEIAVKAGNGSLHDIETAFESGIINGAKRTDLAMAYHKRVEKRNDQVNNVALVDYYINNGSAMNPGNKDHVAAVDEYYRHIKDDPAEVFTLVSKTAIMPSQLKENLAIAARGNPGQVRDAAATFTAMRETTPMVANQVDSLTRERLSSMDYMVSRGVPTDTAFEMIRNAETMPPEERDVKRGVYEREIRSEAPDDLEGGDAYIERMREELQGFANDDDAFDVEFWASSPSANQMLPAYEDMRWRYFNITGDHQSASRMAWNDLRRVYGTTSMNKPVLGALDAPSELQVMAHPPEQSYPVTPEFLEEEIKRFAKNKGIPRGKIMLQSDSLTARRPYGQTDWAVYQLDEWNNPVPVRDDTGEPIRWKPDMQKYQDKVDQQAAEDLKDAMENREELPERQRIQKQLKTARENADARRARMEAWVKGEGQQ